MGRGKARRWQWVALLCLAIFPLLIPEPVNAYTFTNPPVIGGPFGVCPGPGLARRIVPCIKETILFAGNQILVPISNYVGGAITACCVLAIALLGIMLLSGKATAVRDSFVTAMKIGFVALTASNFGTAFMPGGLYGPMLDIMDEMVGMVIGYVIAATNIPCNTGADPPALAAWDYVDCTINLLIGGVLPGTTVLSGISGFLVACMFSQTIGFFIALMGFVLIVQLLFALARALYIYVSAYIGFSLMVLISPIFIPLIIFRATRGYFEKWIKLTLHFMLQPIILFAYLGMLMTAFDTVVYRGPTSPYFAIAGPAALAPNFDLGQWLLGNSVYLEKGVAGQAVQVDTKAMGKAVGLAPEQTGVLNIIGSAANETATDWQNIYGFLGNGFRSFKVDWRSNGVNWNQLWIAAGAPDFTTYILRLFLSMAMALITAYIFLALLEYLPLIAAGLSGKPLGMPTLGTGALSAPGSKFVSGLQTKLSSAFTGGKGT